jgi:hypothetical protein
MPYTPPASAPVFQPVFENSAGIKILEVSESVAFYKIWKKFDEIQKNWLKCI